MAVLAAVSAHAPSQQKTTTTWWQRARWTWTRLSGVSASVL